MHKLIQLNQYLAMYNKVIYLFRCLLLENILYLWLVIYLFDIFFISIMIIIIPTPLQKKNQSLVRMDRRKFSDHERKCRIDEIIMEVIWI